jgi:hypothetical protein
MNPERVIEVTIGLWDHAAAPRGENPPRLAAAIIDALAKADYFIRYEPPSAGPSSSERKAEVDAADSGPSTGHDQSPPPGDGQ